jgi:hypothetical protein
MEIEGIKWTNYPSWMNACIYVPPVSTYVLGQMAYNVKGIWRFERPNKETVGFQGGQNVAEKNPAKALSADRGFSPPEPPAGGEAYTVC